MNQHGEGYQQEAFPENAISVHEQSQGNHERGKNTRNYDRHSIFVSGQEEERQCPPKNDSDKGKKEVDPLVQIRLNIAQQRHYRAIDACCVKKYSGKRLARDRIDEHIGGVLDIAHEHYSTFEFLSSGVELSSFDGLRGDGNSALPQKRA